MINELSAAATLVAAAFFGLVIGYEREVRLKPAGIRTHILVCVGAALFTLLSVELEPSAPSRMAANIVVGVGFLGAGMIIKDKHGISGLTTAASVWTTAAIGVAVGAGFYLVALAGAIIAVLVPLIPHPHSVVEKLRE